MEHKAIAAYEDDDADAADAAKEHDRCGSHLMAPLLGTHDEHLRLIEAAFPATRVVVRNLTSGRGPVDALSVSAVASFTYLILRLL